MKRHLKTITFLTVFAWMALTSCKKEYIMFAGGFTQKDAEKGFAVFSFNSRSGDLTLISEADVGPSPSYFCFSSKDSLLYVINEVMEFRGVFGGGLSTFRYNTSDWQFTKQNELLIPYGGPCYISLSPDSGHLLVANYPNGSVAVAALDKYGIPLEISDTILYYKPDPSISHAHMIQNDPSGESIFVTDLGLDRINVYNLDTNSGKLVEKVNGVTNFPGGSGPRHFVFNSDGSKLYVINEIASTMMVFEVIQGQELKLLQTHPTTSEGYEGENHCADVHISSDGRFLYGSNRGENTIVTFEIGEDGLLSLAGHSSCGGDWPRNFVIDPTGKFILVGNQKSNFISVLKIDSKTGLPSELIKNVGFKSPACLKFNLSL